MMGEPLKSLNLTAIGEAESELERQTDILAEEIEDLESFQNELAEEARKRGSSNGSDRSQVNIIDQDNS